MAKLTRKALIELLERGENLYVVCVSSAYIRDAQYYEPSLLIHDHESGSGEDDDIQNDDNGWIDYTPRDFLGTVVAANEAEACLKIAKNATMTGHIWKLTMCWMLTSRQLTA